MTGYCFDLDLTHGGDDYLVLASVVLDSPSRPARIHNVAELSDPSEPAAFSGTSREPRFAPSGDVSSLRPVYDQIDQVGIDLQYTKDAWLWKLEAIVRDGSSHSFAAAVGGFEYTRYQVRGSSADVGLLLE